MRSGLGLTLPTQQRRPRPLSRRTRSRLRRITRPLRHLLTLLAFARSPQDMSCQAFGACLCRTTPRRSHQWSHTSSPSFSLRALGRVFPSQTSSAALMATSVSFLFLSHPRWLFRNFTTLALATAAGARHQAVSLEAILWIGCKAHPNIATT